MSDATFNETLTHRLAVARGDAPADLVLKGGRVLSVFTGELLDVDVAVAGEHVAGLGRYEGRDIADVGGLILLPGFIDAHLHIESTKLVPSEFARAVLPSGTTTVVVDPHEIANVFGLQGVRELFGAGPLPLDIFVMVSSCVPASAFESSGATVTAEEIQRFLVEEPAALGVAEMMDFPAVVRGDPAAVAKIEAARQAGDRHVDGHAPRLSGAGLNAYVAAGIRSDHECTTYDEALEKRRLGMWVMIREGSAARNLRDLLPLVLRYGPGNCTFCTDDREPDDLVRDGHMNHVMREAVSMGCSPYDAVVLATLNPARYHRLHEHGAVAPGYLADIVAVPDLEHFNPVKVWKRGRLVASEGRSVSITRSQVPDWMRGSVNVPSFRADDFRIRARGRVRAISVEAGQIVTPEIFVEASTRGEDAIADPDRDLAKIAVIERHRGTGRIGIGFVSGFGLQRGALASTYAHDAHNIVVVGVDDTDMATAVNRLAELGGGQLAVSGSQVMAGVVCPIGGLLSDGAVEDVAASVQDLARAARSLGVQLRAPFMTMSFLALSVIPELKITDRGLLDTVRFELVPLEA